MTHFQNGNEGGGVMESPPGIYGTEKTVRSDEVDTIFVSLLIYDRLC